MNAAGRSLSAARQLAGELGGLQDPDRLSEVALVRLSQLFRADCIGLNVVSVSTGETDLVMYPEPTASWMTGALASHLEDHPMVQHYSQTMDMAPLRISDLVADRKWLRSSVYADIFRPLGTERQLVVMLRAGSPTGVVGYAINRSGRDFSDDELALASLVQPILMALQRDLIRSPIPPQRIRMIGAVRPLTRREIDVLSLLADGRTAQAIARALSIAPATVRKHLQNVYEKLDCTDRLTAVNKARLIGLVCPTHENG